MDLAAWYRSHGESVFRRCRRLSNSDEQARDLMQEVFLRAHKYKKTYKGGSPLSWLLTIADRTAYDAMTYDDIAHELSLNEKTVRRSLDKFLIHARAFSEKTNATFESGGSHA